MTHTKDDIIPERNDTFRHLKNVLACKKGIVFPSPAGMSLTKLSLAGNNLVIPGQEEFGINDNLYYIVKLKGVHPAPSYC